MKILSGTMFRVRRTAYSPKKALLKSTILRAPYALLILFLTLLFSSELKAAVGEKAMVVTSDPRATQAALEVLRQGGNAVDAAVTAAWVLNVVEPQSSGIGGGGLILFYDIGTKRILFFDGSVKAPAKASPEMFLDQDGKLLSYRPERNTGGLAVGVPGLLKLTEEVHAKYGTHKFPFARLFEPAILHAEDGTTVSAFLAAALRENIDRLPLLDPKKTVFFEKDAPLQEGQKFSQPELAKAFRLIQAKGTKAFYEGAIAKVITHAVHKNAYRSGLMSSRDLETYRIAKRDPIHTTYQGYDLFSAGPPADGGVVLFRSFSILSHFGIPGFGQSPETYHLLSEAQKVASLHPAAVADPDLFDVPLEELLSAKWAQDRASSIQFDKVLKPGEARNKDEAQGKKRTGSSVMVVDPQGNIVILSATLGDAFGSALRVPGYGFFLNDLLTDLAADPSFVQYRQSAELISGGQRPREPDTPVFIFQEGKPVGLLSAYGPDDPAAVILNVMVQTIDLGVSCGEALLSPRLLVKNDVLRMESGLYDQEAIRLKLEFLGHKTQKEDRIGSAQMVCFDQSSGKIAGESDPRSGGKAQGY